MRRAEAVVFAFRPLGETRQSAALPYGADAVASAGQDLVRIGLVTDIPDHFVLRRVEHVVQRDRQLDDTETRTEMAAGYCDSADRLRAEFVRNLLELLAVELAQVG